MSVKGTILHFCGVFCLIGAGVSFSSSVSFAQKLYKWTDEKGVVHYSSAPKSRDAQQADLPPIMRGEVKLSSQKLVSCDKHGGINCQAGADTDGSVICYDGFRSASARFRFSCSSPKLEITDISDPGTDGTFSVFIRNSKSVAAQKPSVTLKEGEGSEIALSGPREIEAFGMGEFSLPKSAAGEIRAKPDLSQLIVTCGNCP